jgi:uncharacterized SAM-binding protein YcdF (DUF218 family)
MLVAKVFTLRAFKAVLVVLLVWPILAYLLAKVLVVSEPLHQCDLLVVLGGSSAYVERTRHAAALFNRGYAAKIVVTNDNLRSGWLSSEQRNPYFYERAVYELQRSGVPKDKIVVLRQPVKSTLDEAILLHSYVLENRFQSLIVVTSAYHTRRAAWTFRTIFKNSVVRVSVNPVMDGKSSPPATHWWLMSSGWDNVAAEYPKLLYYLYRLHLKS